jgi:hypothetical protein
MCFGNGQKDALQNQISSSASASNQRQQQAFNTAFPYFKNLQNNGLPYFNQLTDYSGGTLAKSAAPIAGAFKRSAYKAGLTPRDPAYLSAMSNFNSNLARTFDQNMVQNLNANQAAKTNASQNLLQLGNASNPAQLYSLLANLVTQ